MQLPRGVRSASIIAAVFVGGGLVLWAGAEVSARLFFGIRPENRFQIYTVRNEIAPGMTVAELRTLLASHDNRGVEHKWFDRSVSVWAHTGLMRSCYLLIELEGGRIVHASVRGERGDQDRLEDAPADF